MEKPASLRIALEKAFPNELAGNPEKLVMRVVDGTVKARKNTLGHTQDYRLCMMFADFPAALLTRLNIIIINWLQTWEPDLLGPGDTDPRGWEFEIDVLGNDTVDAAVVLKLKEDIFVAVENHEVTKIVHRLPPQQYNDLAWPGLPEKIKDGAIPL